MIPPRELICGTICQQYIIFPDGKTRINSPGGDLLYAAAGFLLWDMNPPPGLVSRVGSNFPHEWLEYFSRHGVDISGILVQPEEIDLRNFISYPDLHTRITDNPVAHFSRAGISFPKSLLGYQDNSNRIDSLSKPTILSIRKTDIPDDYYEAGAVHIGPIDYITHSLLPAALRQRNINIITVDPSPGYMNATFWNHIPSLLHGLTAFLPSENEIRSLFHGRSKDIWEMVEALAAFGCDIIVVKRGLAGQILYDATCHKRWELPAYPNQMADPTGAGSSFCGGFLAGYRKTYDPVEAILAGNISASFTVEGADPWYTLDTLPGLADARLEVMRSSLHKI